MSETDKVKDEVHPKFGRYVDGRSAGEDEATLDVELMASHPTVQGTFSVDPRIGSNGFRVVSSVRPDFVLETAERPDAMFVADLLNAMAPQLQQTGEVE
jgi:hypothetical protein